MLCRVEVEGRPARLEHRIRGDGVARDKARAVETRHTDTLDQYLVGFCRSDHAGRVRSKAKGLRPGVGQAARERRELRQAGERRVRFAAMAHYWKNREGVAGRGGIAAVLGANDGIVSTAALIVGVAAAGTETRTILLSGLAGLLAGAMSMAAGEYVSVHSQADAENADLDRERDELEHKPDAELRELASIYMGRGLDPALARQVAEQLTAHDALGAHARDELGISEVLAPRPIQAALSSAAASQDRADPSGPLTST